MIDYLTQDEWDDLKTLHTVVDETFSDEENLLKRDYAVIWEWFYALYKDIQDRLHSEEAAEFDDDIDVLPMSDEDGDRYIQEYREYLEKESEVTIGTHLLRIKIEDISLIVSLDTDRVYLDTAWERTVLTLPEFLEHMTEISRDYPADDTASITNDWMTEIMMEFFSTNINE